MADDTCGCNEGYKWDYTLAICLTLDCQFVAFSTGVKNDEGACVCQQNYEWHNDFRICLINCNNFIGQELIADEDGNVERIGLYNCECKEKAAWEV